ncbi:hypothetical protein CBL_21099, partial [Carabus blaptoides fortunei]
MHKRKQESGAQKRKKEKQREEELAKNTKISKFFSPPVRTITELDKTTLSHNEDDGKCLPSTSSSGHESEFKEKIACSSTSRPRIETEAERLNETVTDMGYYKDKILTDEIKRHIILSTPCKPKGPFKKDPLQNNRHFSESYYYCAYKYGNINRLWLCYSLILDATYCEPCWLFSDSKHEQWRTGVRDWQGLSKKIKIHSNSQKHITACKIYDYWKKNKTIDKERENLIAIEASFWERVLERLFNITLLLSKNSLAFRGHREQTESDYNGNFLSQVMLLAKYDDVMKEIVNKPKGAIKYLSPSIQNELISCLGQHLLNSIINEINASPFFSIICDTTQDINKVDQMSIIIRYVHLLRNEESEATGFFIKESFIGFFSTKDHSATGMTSQILSTLEHLSIDIKKCRGQGYDGASVMS